MILGKLQLTESTNLEFGLEIFGTTEKANQVRFVIEGPEFDIACRCKVEKGDIVAVIPKLKDVLPSGVYESRLEVIVDGKLFTPLKESIEFEPNIEFGVQTKKATPVKEGVQVKFKSVSEDVTVNKLQADLNKLVAEGYEVVELNGFKVVKKADAYFGIVSESKILQSKSGYDTLNELVEALSK